MGKCGRLQPSLLSYVFVKPSAVSQLKRGKGLATSCSASLHPAGLFASSALTPFLFAMAANADARNSVVAALRRRRGQRQGRPPTAIPEVETETSTESA